MKSLESNGSRALGVLAGPGQSPGLVLVLKLGALGDFVLAFSAFAAIRAHHPGCVVVLLTTSPFVALASSSPWFDEVRVDHRPSWWNLVGIARLRQQLAGFGMVYDLQTSGRSSRYFRLAGRPAWSGIAAGSLMPHANPRRDRMHTLERQRDQLVMAGVTVFPEPDLGWLTADVDLPGAYAVLVPGAAAHRPAKRWPIGHFSELAKRVVGKGLVPVVLGSRAEAPLGAAIRAACPQAIDLTGRTSLPAVAAIARRARVAVGNDTGPMHLAAAVGCPCVVLFSGDSDPALTAPRGPGGSWPVLLREANLSDLPVDRVAASLG